MTKAASTIFFLSDNHNGDLMGCAGHPLVRTPHLDQIARAGTRFANSYSASPLCGPARASLATGRWPHQTGHWDNCLVYDGAEASWGHRLREAGHRTASAGKLHYRSSEDDNGFDDEVVPMHILDGVGGLPMLLRWNNDQPRMPGQWKLYWNNLGAKETEYQVYDKEITANAIAWLERHAATKKDQPFTLFVSYVSSHPPFQVPQRLLDLYPLADMPLPYLYTEDVMPRHPSLEHLRWIKGYHRMDDETVLRQIIAGYYGLITHLDEQIGQVLAAAERLGLLDGARLMYSSDHGEAYGNHAIFGKNNLMEPSIRVPLLYSGPDVPANHVVRQFVSAVDVFPTLVEGGGAKLTAADADIAGQSLFPVMYGGEDPGRIGFAEFHASASKTGGFMLRDGMDKLIYHVGMRPQLYDLAADPQEAHDRMEQPDAAAQALANRLEAKLREIVNPEEADAAARAAQGRRAAEFGGNDAIRDKGTFDYTPPPGHAPRFG